MVRSKKADIFSQRHGLRDDQSYQEMVAKIERNDIILKLARKYEELYQEGNKSFAVISTGYPELQQRVILSVASLLQKNAPSRKMLLIMNSHSVILRKFLNNAVPNRVTYLDHDIKIYNFYGLYEMVILGNVIDVDYDTSLKKYNRYIKKVAASYDMILWDLPLIDDIKSRYGHYYPILELLTNLFLVLPSKGSQKDEISYIRDYFANFNIEISGLVQESKGMSQKRWWEFWK